MTYGDIAQPTRLYNRNAVPCTARGCTWPKSSTGKVFVPVEISGRYSKCVCVCVYVLMCVSGVCMCANLSSDSILCVCV